MITSKGLMQLGFDKYADFVLQDDGNGTYISEWLSSSDRPTTADIEAAHTEWQAEYDAQEYARNRSLEYPSIDELVVALWEGVVEERMAAVTKLEAKRQAVKLKYPK
tara:strand:- start:20 stop:340 length:321 start_codon:yes stop_codon:yes gene_type:complete